jgi:hypothetical protein
MPSPGGRIKGSIGNDDMVRQPRGQMWRPLDLPNFGR